MDPIKRFLLAGHLRRVPPPLPKRPQRIDYRESLRRMTSEVSPRSVETV
jgi:hypothetical protein